MPSDIQVFVRWKEQAIFAGEDVECTITFKNVAPSPSAPDSDVPLNHYRRGSRPANGVVNGANYSPAKSLNPFTFNARRSQPSSPRVRQTFERTHRPAASLSSPLAFSHSFPPTVSGNNNVGPGHGHRHKRSVSIISLEPDKSGERKHVAQPFSPRPGRGHARSASVQVPPRRNEAYGNTYPSGHRSPMNRLASADSPSNLSLPSLHTGTESPRVPGRSHSEISSPTVRGPNRQPLPLPTDFKFPQAPPTPTETNHCNNVQVTLDEPPTADFSPIRPPSAKGPPALEPPARLAPAAKVLSDSSINGSTRSSMEFYSLSNNSSETLASDYVGYPMNRSPLPLRHRRHYSNLDAIARSPTADSQTLLMGYAQISASFTVDGSLVNQALFEEVKRKGVLGSQVRAEGQPKPEKSRGGFWGTLGLNTIGDSLSGMLSTGELNGLRDMRGVTSSQSIPLLSTSQSLLFVDLRLSPGEERSFSFSFTLPRGLPASHKGKAIKVSYNLVIGTQRAINVKEAQRVHRINIPFRVLSGVDGHGGVLGHDLMRPYVLLRDEARVQRVDSAPARPTKEKSISAKSWNSAPEFLSYVDEILDPRRRRDSFASGTPLDLQPNSLLNNGQFSCKDAIDFAILRSNQSSGSDRSTNRFEITRSGRRIAVVVLNRPFHRLGETVMATIDFSNAALPCYSVRGSLETSEKVSPTIALRSSASIARATRRIHATCFENTLFSTRVVFTPAIPISATPTIITSGVNLEWELRFEFVTSSLHDEEDIGASGIDLLEKVEQDDRGTVFSSLESVSCESFEVAIPLTVYGGSVLEPAGEEVQGVPI
ncbi:hypothetical protein AJ80_02423 [Polytolypa hystricis UAMH7299]|uniref:Uncharacterized protein n=1 Tax=Polytolypa hystricis (strain UAMH7299) TaxID=1447883 RepID=A0A2B7YR12_POLH7|nr:hypothetical protein AJ80_02423 [Polytolypa hystricis UAMH7299]